MAVSGFKPRPSDQNLKLLTNGHAASYYERNEEKLPQKDRMPEEPGTFIHLVRICAMRKRSWEQRRYLVVVVVAVVVVELRNMPYLPVENNVFSLKKKKKESPAVGFLGQCTPVADSCWCMAKPIQYCKVKKKIFFNKKNPHLPSDHNAWFQHLGHIK